MKPEQRADVHGWLGRKLIESELLDGCDPAPVIDLVIDEMEKRGYVIGYPSVYWVKSANRNSAAYGGISRSYDRRAQAVEAARAATVLFNGVDLRADVPIDWRYE